MRSSILLHVRLQNNHGIAKGNCLFYRSSVKKCHLHEDGRNRLSNFWTPTGGIAKGDGQKEDSHSLLIRAGFVRQAHSGLFHFLPLGLRVQSKIEGLLDFHMTRLGASKVSLSTLSSEELWKRSGRLNGDRSELFHVKDRKDAHFLLAPTHEEEVTSLVSKAVHSWKDLPLRLYQITRKYRDEPRPRQGLLRTREFVMKDLYTFDTTKEEALETYRTVRRAYSALFDELKIPYLTAEADSGSIGGDLSHEYHIFSSKGEDNVISCTSCNYVANEEVAKRGSRSANTGDRLSQLNQFSDESENKIWVGMSRDRQTLYRAVYPSTISSDGGPTRLAQINPHVLNEVFDDVDLGVDTPHDIAADALKVQWAVDYRLSETSVAGIRKLAGISGVDDTRFPIVDLVNIETGDQCRHCGTGTFKVDKAVELGHTFYLGTKYSEPLGANVIGPEGISKPIEMGCHGIGVSRMIAAIADTLADGKGLNWPRVVAPFETVIITAPGLEETGLEVLDRLCRKEVTSTSLTTLSSGSVDAILDDRKKDMGWKLNDADLIGYPVIVVLGKEWRKKQLCEVQCRRLSIRDTVPLENLKSFIVRLLAQL
jgi:prolyl-tRNA synthetase